MTAKEYLSEIAEAAGAVARFDRNGVLRLDWLTNSGLVFDENRYSAFSPAEYTTARIGKLQVRNSDQDIGTIVGSGEETYILQQNALLQGSSQSGYAGNLLTRLAAIPPYAPATASLFADWSMRAGDVIALKQKGQTFTIPVMRLTMRWTGSPKIDVEATGNEHRATVSAINRQEYRTGYAIHEVENSLETFRSYIQSPEGAASIIEQSATAIHISASQIDLKGYTTINGFQIDNDGYLRATGGTIGGFTITGSQIKSNGNNPNLVLDSSGSLTCKSGTIGGFTITGTQIKSDEVLPRIVLNADGTATIGQMQINSNGTQFSGTVTVNGTVYCSSLTQYNSNDTINGGWLAGGSVGNTQLGTDSVRRTQIKDGEVTDGKLASSFAKNATITNLTNGTTVAGTIRSTTLEAVSTFVLQGYTIKTREFTLSSGIYRLCYAEESG